MISILTTKTLKLEKKKIILFLSFFISILPIFLLLDWRKFTNNELILLFLGELFGYIGIHLLFWQFILTSRNSFTIWFEDIVWLTEKHKAIGKYGIILIFLHPIFVSLYYLTFEINILIPSLNNEFEVFKFFGQIGFYILLTIWISSALLRNKISYRIWKKIHLLSYIVLPLVLVHSIFLASGNTQNLKIYSIIISLISAVVFVHKILLSSTILKYKSKIVNIIDIGKNIKEIVLENKLPTKIKNGQFLFVQTKPFGEEHPYTISQINPENKTISITVKSIGFYSKSLLNLKINDTVFLDGPYGVFTKEAYNLSLNEDIILIAGGIGITPFVEIIKNINYINKKVYLFFFNKTEDDIAYRNFFKEIQHKNKNFTYVEILSDQENFDGEKGYFSINLLKKYISTKELQKNRYFVCGPEKMMEMVIKQLKEEGINGYLIHYEKFTN